MTLSSMSYRAPKFLDCTLHLDFHFQKQVAMAVEPKAYAAADCYHYLVDIVVVVAAFDGSSHAVGMAD